MLAMRPAPSPQGEGSCQVLRSLCGYQDHSRVVLDRSLVCHWDWDWPLLLLGLAWCAWTGLSRGILLRLRRGKLVPSARTTTYLPMVD